MGKKDKNDFKNTKLTGYYMFLEKLPKFLDLSKPKISLKALFNRFIP